MKAIKNLFRKLITFLGGITLFFIIAIFFTTVGYRSVTQDVKVAEISLIPKNQQEFDAVIEWSTGEKAKYSIKGDQLYIDAKILKWQGWARYLGLKTWYEFDRIGGRYIAINDERTKERSVYDLSKQKDYDLYNIRKKYPMLEFLVDSEYGSAAFFMADSAKKIELSVSNSGLTIRTKNSDQQPNITIE